MASPDKIILTSAMLTLGSTTAASMMPEAIGGKGELPSPKLLFGTTLTFAGLSMAADGIPEIVVPLSLAIAFTAVTYYGIPIADKAFTEDKPKRKRKNARR